METIMMTKRKRAVALCLCLVMLSCFLSIPGIGLERLPQNELEYPLPADLTVEGLQNYNTEIYGLSYRAPIEPVPAQKAENGKTEDGTEITVAAGDYTIDIESELLLKANPDAPDVTHISLDNGNTFKPIKSFPDTGMDLSKLIGKKAISIVLITLYDTKEKKPAVYVAANEQKGIVAAAGSAKYSFPAIAARPAPSKFSIDYYALRHKTGETNGAWTLAVDKTPVSDLNKYQIGVVGAEKNKPDAAGWGEASNGIGVKVQPLSSSGKTMKTQYMVRIAPKDAPLTPASKPKKLTASGVLKAPKYKLDYKKELIKVKADTIYTVAAEYWEDPESEKPDAFRWENYTPLTPFSKESAKTGLSFFYKNSSKEDCSYYGKTLLFRTLPPASGKKPASALQAVTLSGAAQIKAADITPKISNGKMTLPTGYEAKVGDKWKTVVTEDLKTVQVRRKNTAKYNPKTNATAGLPASNTVTFSLGCGNYDISNTKKTGIVTYAVTQDLYGYSLLPKNFPLVQNVTSQTALEGITEIVFEPINANPIPEGELEMVTNLPGEGEAAFYNPTLNGRTISLDPGTLTTGTYTFTLVLKNGENTADGFFCPIVVINILNPNDPKKVNVTLDDSVYEDGSNITSIKYSISSAAGAIDGLNFPEKGVDVALGTTIYIYMKRVVGGKTETQSLYYKAVATDAQNGKVLSATSGWKDYSDPKWDDAAASASGGEIVLTFSENISTVSKQSFSISGAGFAGNEVTGVRIDSSKKTTVIISLKNKLEKGSTVTVTITGTGVRTVSAYTFTSGSKTVTTSGIATPTPTPTPTPKPTLPPTPSTLPWE